LKLYDGEIVINPILKAKFEHDFSVTLPSFDAENDLPKKYLENLFFSTENNIVDIDESVYLTCLSFSKISMYKDLEKYRDKLKENSVIIALTGKSSGTNT